MADCTAKAAALAAELAAALAAAAARVSTVRSHCLSAHRVLVLQHVVAVAVGRLQQRQLDGRPGGAGWRVILLPVQNRHLLRGCSGRVWANADSRHSPGEPARENSVTRLLGCRHAVSQGQPPGGGCTRLTVHASPWRRPARCQPPWLTWSTQTSVSRWHDSAMGPCSTSSSQVGRAAEAAAPAGSLLPLPPAQRWLRPSAAKR